MNTKNLKPFDLGAALKGEPVILRNGQKAFVRHHETDATVGDSWLLWGVITTEGGSATLAWWSKEGRFSEDLKEHDQDIIGMWPKTRIINGFEVPAPETEELEVGDMYFTPSISFEDFHDVWEWRNTKLHKCYLERGLVFLNAEAAIANAKAMLGINPYEESEE